jgi:hypothetical protein
VLERNFGVVARWLSYIDLFLFLKNDNVDVDPNHKSENVEACTNPLSALHSERKSLSETLRDMLN